MDPLIRARRARDFPASLALAASMAALFHGAGAQQSTPAAQALDGITVLGPRPSSLPLEIPTTVESITRKQIDETINATDAEDVLKYFPSLIVRKRYIGDYDHAVLGSRASGTGNSARSLVYADGMLLSNLLGNGAAFTPRWALVMPEEIERVDVLYGPFSAAYSGNSVGAVVDFVTRMPRQTEAHAKVSFFDQHFRERATDGRFGGGEGSVALGSRSGPFAWWIDATRLDGEGQPVSFANRLQSAGARGGPGVPVSGAFFDQNPKYQNWYLLGSTTQTHTTQDHAKLKVSYDVTSEVTATYVFGTWKNDSVRSSSSYLRDAAGAPVYSGNVVIDGLSYALTASDFAPTRSRLEHDSHGLSIKSATNGNWDFAADASLYAYQEDLVRTPTVAVPSASTSGAGTITDGKGTGWTTLAAKATWRPDPAVNAHVVEFGLQRDVFKLRTRVSPTTDWIGDGPASTSAQFNGDTDLTSLWAQDAWRFAPDWKAIVGLRGERWSAHDGQIANATRSLTYGARRQGDVSPKAAVGYGGVEDWSFKASVGRAVRFPTVSELYQGAIIGNVVMNNDPNLRPERSWTSELTAERNVDRNTVRFTYFHERTHDALYSQANVNVTPSVTNIQNVDLIRTNGLEVSAMSRDLLFTGVDLAASVTRAWSTILADANFPAAVGKLQPRVPNWRANLVGTWHASDATDRDARCTVQRSAVRYARQQRSERLHVHRLLELPRRRHCGHCVIASTGTGRGRSASTTSTTGSTGPSIRIPSEPMSRNWATTCDHDGDDDGTNEEDDEDGRCDVVRTRLLDSARARRHRRRPDHRTSVCAGDAGGRDDRWGLPEGSVQSGESGRHAARRDVTGRRAGPVPYDVHGRRCDAHARGAIDRDRSGPACRDGAGRRLSPDVHRSPEAVGGRRRGPADAALRTRGARRRDAARPGARRDVDGAPEGDDGAVGGGSTRRSRSRSRFTDSGSPVTARPTVKPPTTIPGRACASSS